MADVLYLKDGSTKVIFDHDDFIKLISEYMGTDAEYRLKEIISDLQDKADYTAQKVNTDLDSYESQLDSQTAAFNDILDGLEKIQDMINNQLNRKALQQIVDSCMKEVLNQI